MTRLKNLSSSELQATGHGVEYREPRNYRRKIVTAIVTGIALSACAAGSVSADSPPSPTKVTVISGWSNLSTPHGKVSVEVVEIDGYCTIVEAGPTNNDGQPSVSLTQVVHQAGGADLENKHCP